MMELKDVIIKRRSIREYADKQIPEELILEICNFALNAPSASNMKSWKLVGINEKDIIHKIRRFSPGMGHTPPGLIVIGIDQQKAVKKAGPMANKQYSYYDAAIVAYNICLLALEYGLGSCIMASFNKDAIGKFVGFPEHIHPILVVSIGYPLNKTINVSIEREEDSVSLQSYKGR